MLTGEATPVSLPGWLLNNLQQLAAAQLNTDSQALNDNMESPPPAAVALLEIQQRDRLEPISDPPV